MHWFSGFYEFFTIHLICTIKYEYWIKILSMEFWPFQSKSLQVVELCTAIYLLLMTFQDLNICETLLCIWAPEDMANSSMADSVSTNHTLTNQTASAAIFIMAPSSVLRISNVVSITALILNTINIALIALMPKSKLPTDRNFKIFVIYLSAVNIVMMAEQTVLDFETMQFILLRYHALCVLSATLLHSQIVYCGWLLLLVSVERLIAAFAPYSYQNHIYISRFGWPLAISHIMVTGLYIVIAALFQDKAYSVKGSGCCQMGGRETPMLGLVTLGQGFFILILISVMYMILLCKEKRMLRQITPLMSTYTWQRRRIVTRQLNITIGAILVSKFTGWLPIMIMVMLRPTPYAVPMLDYCGRITLHSFSVMTPIAYGLVSSRYRRFLRQKTEEISARIRSLSEYCGSHICRCHCCGHSNS